MATRNKNVVTMDWRELGAELSKAQVLLPDEDIANLTLVKPRTLRMETERHVVVTPKTDEPES